jgi:transposase
MKDLEERLKEYENELGNRDEIEESHEKARYELAALTATNHQLQERAKQLENEVRTREMRLDEARRDAKTLQADLVKKEERML